MPVASWLWTELRDLFETDDCSLPEVRVDYTDPEATIRGYALLRKSAHRVLPETLDSVSNAAALVVSREAEVFHAVFQGIQSQGVTLPDLGAFVFPDQLALDYRMGAEWGPAKVEAFFGLLSALAGFDPHTSLSLEEGVLPEVLARFHAAWRRYIEEHAA
jgi:hypothetical protein